MTPVTVKELSELLNKLVKQGYGNYAVQVSDDDECNGFHSLWVKHSAMEGEDVIYLDNEKKTYRTKKSIVLS